MVPSKEEDSTPVGVSPRLLYCVGTQHVSSDRPVSSFRKVRFQRVNNIFPFVITFLRIYSRSLGTTPIEFFPTPTF